MRSFEELFEPVPGQQVLFPEEGLLREPPEVEVARLERLARLLRSWARAQEDGTWYNGETLARAAFLGSRRVEDVAGCREAGL